MAGLLDNRECWPREGRTLNQLLDRLGVKAVKHNGQNQLLDPVIQLLVLSDAAPIVS